MESIVVKSEVFSQSLLTARTEQGPTVDLLDRTIQSWDAVELVNEHVAKIGIQWTQLKMQGNSQVGVRPSNREGMQVKLTVVHRRTTDDGGHSLQYHRWHSKKRVSWNK